MPVFTALMTSAFGGMDPFEYLGQNDRYTKDSETRPLPFWVVKALERDIQHSQTAE